MEEEKTAAYDWLRYEVQHTPVCAVHHHPFVHKRGAIFYLKPVFFSFENQQKGNQRQLSRNFRYRMFVQRILLIDIVINLLHLNQCIQGA